MHELGNTSWGNEGGGKKTNFVFKDGFKEWMLYQLNRQCVVKVYPAFDAQGNMCPVRMPSEYEVNGVMPDTSSMDDGERVKYQKSLVPPAFTMAPIATFVGKDKLQFVDHCYDMSDYNAVDTPYRCLVRGLMATVKNRSDNIADGHPTELSAVKALTNPQNKRLSYSSGSVLCRGALVTHKNNAPTGKKVQNGILYTCVFAIPQQSAVLSFLQGFVKQYDVMQPLSATNFTYRDIFNPQGTLLMFDKQSYTDNSKPYDASVVYRPDINANIVQTIGAHDEASYYQKLNTTFGTAATVGDMLYIMSCKEMVEHLLTQFDPALVWYGLKDSPYADLVPAEAMQQAHANPEIAARLGIAPTAQPTINTQPQGGFGSSFGGGGFTTPAQPTSFQPQPQQPQATSFMQANATESYKQANPGAFAGAADTPMFGNDQIDVGQATPPTGFVPQGTPPLQGVPAPQATPPPEAVDDGMSTIEALKQKYSTHGGN